MRKNTTGDVRKILTGFAAEWGRGLIDLLYPPRCPLCEQLLPKERVVCSRCEKALPYVKKPLCLCCGKPLADERRELCEGCLAGEHLFTAGASAFVYEGALREAMMRLKFHNKRENVRFFAKAMAVSGAEFLREHRPALILPVPMHAGKRRKRGYDQAVLLAKALSEETRIPVRTDLLRRTRATRAQKRLDLQSRRRNLRGAFAVKNPEEIREPVLLVDDIYTSGATIDSICEELHRNGIREILFMTACITAGGGRT